MNKDRHIDHTRIHDITIEEVRACPEFEHLTDEEAKIVIETIKTFAKIAFDHHKKASQSVGN